MGVTRTVEDFFDHEYRDYALYTISSRAIPHAIDGFKPAQRKIAFAASRIWKTGSEKPLKVFQLGGQAAAMSFFHHGSLDETIIGMTQGFKNSLPIFHGIGQFGSLRAPEAGAPRYVGVRANDNFRKLYKDFNLTTPQHEEGEEIEPRFFLPIVPTVLLNGGSGIAVGFATNILNRHPLDLIDACIEYLESGVISSALRPWIRGFHGDVVPAQDNGRSWEFRGACAVKNTSVVEVTEIPPSLTFERYEAILEGLIERSILHGYEDASSERVRYVLRFPRAGLAALIEKDKLFDTLRLREVETENLTTLDEHGKLKVFETAHDLVRYFVNFRLDYYAKRKTHLLDALAHDIVVLDNKARFIEAVVNGKVVVAGAAKDTIVRQIRAAGISEHDGGFDYLLSMPIHVLTREKRQEMLGKLRGKRAEQKQLNDTTPKMLYLTDLEELCRQLGGTTRKTQESTSSDDVLGIFGE